MFCMYKNFIENMKILILQSVLKVFVRKSWCGKPSTNPPPERPRGQDREQLNGNPSLSLSGTQERRRKRTFEKTREVQARVRLHRVVGVSSLAEDAHDPPRPPAVQRHK